MSCSPASIRRASPALAVAFLLFPLACGDGDRPRTPTQPPVFDPEPNPTWEAMAEETAGAVVGTLTWALENADTIESQGYWDPTTGSWRVATALPFGQPADLSVQFRNSEGAVRKHYVAGTTAEIVVAGRVASETSSTELEARVYAIESGNERALSEFSGAVTSGAELATYSGRTTPIWKFVRPLPLYTVNGGMNLRFGDVTLTLNFLGDVVLVEYFYPEGGPRNEFTFCLQPQCGEA